MARAQTLAARVKARRAELGLSQAQVEAAAKARKEPLSHSRLAEIETGKSTNPTLDVLRGVAAGLQWSVPELLGEGAHAVRTVPLRDLYDDPDNPRETWPDDATTQGLIDSIRQVGLLQPLTIRQVTAKDSETWQDGPVWVVVDGHRRLQALRAIHGEKSGEAVSVAVVKVAHDREAQLAALSANMQRADMTPLDVADCFAKLRKEGVTNQELKTATGKSIRWVQEYVAVGERLCLVARDYLKTGKLTISQCIALAGERDGAQQAALADEAARRRLTEEDIRSLITGAAGVGVAAASKAQADIEDLPGVKQWPKPNKHGVYEPDRKTTYSFKHAQIHEAAIELLQIAPDTWLRARLVRHGYGGVNDPLTAKIAFPSPAKAFADAALSIGQVLDNFYRDEAVGWGPSRRRSLEVAINEFAVWCGDTVLTFGTIADAEKLRDKLLGNLAKNIRRCAPAASIQQDDEDEDEDEPEEPPAGDDTPSWVTQHFLTNAQFCVIDHVNAHAQFFEGFGIMVAYVRSKLTDAVDRKRLLDADGWQTRGVDSPWLWRSTTGSDDPDIEVVRVGP